MTADIAVPAILFVSMMILHILRQKEIHLQPISQFKYEVGAASTFGTREIQQDYFGVKKNQNVLLMLLADGIGENGEIAAKLTVDTFRDLFEDKNAIHKPQYFFRRAANAANKKITNTLEERQGESSIAAVMVEGSQFFYTVVGNCKINVFRNGDLIPVSEGQTLDVLARHTYSEGKISKQKTLTLLDKHRRYNVLGQDSFSEIEFLSKPLQLKKNDLIVIMSEGIFNTLRWVEIESVLEQKKSAQKLADEIIRLANNSSFVSRENGTILICKC
jgi:serine/threonine protein phosphatase PrpC